MTKADLIDVICERTGLQKSHATETLEALLEIVKVTLEAGEEVKVSGFGKFEVKKKNERRGRNPQTGEEITIDSRKILTFKASNMLKGAINATKSGTA